MRKIKVDKITYYFYTPKLNIEIKDANIISNGNSSIVVCDAQNSKKVKSRLPEVLGESVRITDYSKETLSEIMNKYSSKIKKIENINNYQFLLCYDDSLPKFVLVDEQKINLQIAITDSEIDVGYPLILNGY